MIVSVLDFYRKETEEGIGNPFLTTLHEPIFFIVVNLDGKKRELVLKMSGDVECPPVKNVKDFEFESYRNYLIITNFLLSEQGNKIRLHWGLSEEDFREFIFELYFCLVNNYSTCGMFKKAFLVLLGLWKFYAGRKLR